MAFRTGLLFLLLVCVIGLGWLLGGEDEPGAPLGSDEADAGLDGTAPALTTTRRPVASQVSAADPEPARPLPTWLLGKLPGQRLGLPLRKRLVTWIEADPRNLDDFIADVIRRTSKWGTHATFQTASAEFTLFRDIADRLVPLLRARLSDPEASPERKAALLGAISGLAWGPGRTPRTLMELDRIFASSEEPVGIRTLAARQLIWNLRDDHVAPIRALLHELASPPGFELLLFLAAMKPTRERAKPFVPTLLALLPQLEGRDGYHELILEIIAQSDPTNPAAHDLFVDGLGHPKPAVQALALIALAEGNANDLVAALEGATAAARVAGARMLLQKGVARDRIAGLLLSALASGGPGVRDQAITLLPRVQPDPRAALPVIQDLLAGDDRGRWISGTRALGALTTGSGARDDIMQLLFTAARLPESKVRILAVQSLLMYDDQAKAVVPVLADLLRDSDAAVRAEAVDGLGEMSARSDAARPYLQTALGDGDENVRKLAKYWLELDDEDDD